MHDGEKLKLLRIFKGYSQKGVATGLGITQQAYSLTEQKEIIDEALLKKILQHIKCSTDELKSFEIFITRPPNKKH